MGKHLFPCWGVWGASTPIELSIKQINLKTLSVGKFIYFILQEIVREAETGTRFADQLVKVFLRDGKEKWLLIHIEVQSQPRSDFAKRMYIYNHRLFDRYNQKVISLAVLADERESWRPREFGYELWGFESYLRFPTVKLLDYQPRWQELEESTNPFAVYPQRQSGNMLVEQGQKLPFTLEKLLLQI